MDITTSASTTTVTAAPAFLPVASVRLAWGDGGPVQPGTLPIPSKCRTGPCLAAFEIRLAARLPSRPREENEKAANQVTIPMRVVYIDARTGQKVADTGPGYQLFNGGAPNHFGIPDPPDRIVGHFDDPGRLPKERRDLLRERILSALDVLLPFFTDDTRPWTEQATKAAQEVRDFFPLAAEPGLWPYYRAEGKDFFSWVEKNAPVAKAPLPW